jgi:BASS family bile acid:Na+ symporter
VKNLTLQIMTPFLTAKLAGKYVAVDAIGLLMSTLQVSFPSVTSCLSLINYDASISSLLSSLTKNELSL